MFVLRDIEGLSTAETAVVLGLTETNAKVRLHRARLALRERLTTYLSPSLADVRPVVAVPRWGDKTMYCKEMLGSLSDYIDGDLEAQLCAEIEQHMAECGNCRVVVDTLSKTVSLYREYGHEQVPPEAKERLYAVLKLEAGS